MTYKVKLDAFEGPLDLLLFLIKKNEIDIYDIPISTITHQYLEYIDVIKLLDIEAAGDFIFMASTLMRLKAQMLLPKPEVDELEEVEDPRQELVYRLLDYKRFKEVATKLADREQKARQFYPRGSFKFERSNITEEIINSSDVTLFDLIAAFKKMAESREKVSFHHVQDISVNVEERIQFVQQKLKEHKEMEFSRLFNDKDDKIVWIVTFIAILELIRQHEIRALQEDVFGEIYLARIDGAKSVTTTS